MTTQGGPSSKNNRLKEIVVTAAVASLVSAVVTPWLRRWMDAGGLGFGPNPQPPALPPSEAGHGPERPDDFRSQLDRLLEVPNPFSRPAGPSFAPLRGRQPETNERNDDDDLDDDPGA